MLAGLQRFIETGRLKYLNNLIEQDHRFIKKIAKPMLGFKHFHLAQTTIDGIETAYMIRKGQLFEVNIPAYQLLKTLARWFFPHNKTGCGLGNICDKTGQLPGEHDIHG